MTTELDINRLANRLREAYPGSHTAISMNVDSYSSGARKAEWNAYCAAQEDMVSQLCPTLAELEDWLNANWLKEGKAGHP